MGALSLGDLGTEGFAYSRRKGARESWWLAVRRGRDDRGEPAAAAMVAAFHVLRLGRHC